MIVEANKDHLEKILGIELDSFDNPWSYQSFLNEINNDVGSNWVYLQHANLLGYMFGWIIQGDYHINNIAVKVSARRKGLAKKMIDNIIFSPRIKNVYLEVSRLNESAIRLYEKIGFRENGVRKKYYSNGADAILYKMELR
tara:strand:+ start:141 stop:563 length:423 start_codon:yes stop_codon:yes gene_type:complete